MIYNDSDVQQNDTDIYAMKDIYMGLPGGSEGKASACSAEDLGSIPVLGRSPGEGNGNPLLPGKFHGWRILVGLQSMGSQKVAHD